MKKPAGVIVAAVLLVLLAFIGAVSTIMLGVIFPMTPHPGLNTHAAAVVEAILVACFAVPTLFTGCIAVGLFRGKNWARIGGTVLGVLLALGGAFFALSSAVFMQMPRFQAQVHTTRFAFILNIVFALLAAAFGLWMVIYLNLAPVRRAFRPDTQYVPATGTYPPPAFDLQSPQPAAAGLKVSRIVILVLAALSGLGSLVLLVMAAAGLPLLYPGLELQGHAAALAMIVFAAINLVVAIGLYRRFRPAYYAAIALQLLSALFGLLMLLPSYRERWIAASMAMSARISAPPPPQMATMMHNLQSGVLTFNALLVPCIAAFFIWALLRDLKDTRP